MEQLMNFAEKFGFPTVMCLIFAWAIFIQFPKTLREITDKNTTTLDNFAQRIAATVDRATAVSHENTRAASNLLEAGISMRTEGAMKEIRGEFARLDGALAKLAEEIRRLRPV